MPLIIYFSGAGDGTTTTTHGYTMTALVMALIAVPLFYAVFLTSREVITPVHQGREIPLGEELKVVLTNRNFMMVFCAFLFAMTAFFGRIGIQLYYYIYDLQRMDLVSVLMMLPLFAAQPGGYFCNAYRCSTRQQLVLTGKLP